MRRRTLSLAISAVFAPTLGYTLGLGEISTNSALNQQLDADIQLVSTAAEEVDDVTVRLAPKELFDQVGITRSGLLDQLRFEPVVVNGATIIKVTSLRPIQEPFLTFVIEVSWPKGKLLREYTVLLDPPVLGDPMSPVRTAAAPAPVEAAPEPIADAPVVTGAGSAGVAPFVGGAPVETFPSVTAEPVEEDIPIAETVAIAETVSEAETFSVTGAYADEGAGEGSSDIFVSQSEELVSDSVESAEEFVAEAEIAEAETFSVAEIAPDVAQDFDSAGSSDIFVTDPGDIGSDASVEFSEAVVADVEPETFSIEPDDYAPVEESFETIAAEAEPEIVAEAEFETFAEPESIGSWEQDQQIVPDEGTSEIFVSVPDYQEPASIAEYDTDETVSETSYYEDEYEVNRGDTLFSIAKNSRPNDGVTVTQMMAAFLRENPGAFVNGNINQLKSGFILRIPDEATVAQASHKEAVRELAGHGGEAFTQYRSKMAEAAVPQQAIEGGAVAGIEDLVSGRSADAEEVAEAGEAAAGEKPALEILVVDDKSETAAANQIADATGIAALEKEVALAREHLESRNKEAAELESRVAELEGIVAAKERLIQLKDGELSDLQQTLSEGTVTLQASEERAAEAMKAAEAQAAEMKVAETKAAEQQAAVAKAAEERAAEQQAAEAKAAEEKAAEEQAAEAKAAEERVAEEQAAEEAAEVIAAQEPVADVSTDIAATKPAPVEPEELVSDSKSNPNLLIGAGIGALLLSMLAWLVFRKKPPQEEEPVLVAGEKAVSDGKPLYSDGGHDVVAEDPLDLRTEVIEPVIGEAEIIEPIEVGESTAAVEDEAEVVAAMTAELAADDLDFDLDVEPDLSATGEVDSLEDEVLSEANVYLAYGLHDQAIELLKPAVESNPGRTDYASKLLEAYHATGDKESFTELATSLHDKVGTDSSNPMWQRAVVMGKDLVPGHALFANADPGGLTLTTIQNQRAELSDIDVDEGPLTEVGGETLSMNSDEIETGFDIEQDPAGEFELPDLDELSQSLQMDGDEVTAALRESQDELSQEIQADLTGQLEDFKPEFDHTMALDDDDASLTLADVEGELTSLTTGADEISTKLDLAKAYLDMGDDEGAREALEEVISHGDATQSSEAKKLMDQIG